MNAITFDTLSISKRLKTSGFSEPQAEAIAREIQESGREDHLVTREFLSGELGKFRGEIEMKLESLELRLIVKVGGMIIALGGLLVAIKYFG